MTEMLVVLTKGEVKALRNAMSRVGDNWQSRFPKAHAAALVRVEAKLARAEQIAAIYDSLEGTDVRS